MFYGKNRHPLYLRPSEFDVRDDGGAVQPVWDAHVDEGGGGGDAGGDGKEPQDLQDGAGLHLEKKRQQRTQTFFIEFDNCFCYLISYGRWNRLIVVVTR